MSSSIRTALVVTSVFAAAFLISESAAAEEAAPANPAAAAVATTDSVTALKRLDLRAPDVTQLFTQEQIRQVLAASFRETIEEVEVEGERGIRSTPDVWPGIFAPVWAVMNPTQAWRIIAPLPPDQTRGMQQARFNATDSYVLQPAGTIQLDY